MKVARRKLYLVDASVAVTGAFVSAREIARTMRDHADVVLVLPREANITAEELRDFAGVQKLPIRSLRRSFLDVILYLPCLLWAAIQLRHLLEKDGADVLLVNDFYLMQGALVRALGFRGRIVTWVRIDPSIFGQVARIWLWAVTLTSDTTIAVSKHIQRLLPVRLLSEVLYDPVSAEFLCPPAPDQVPGYSFIFLGNYIRGKGQDAALDALAITLRSFPGVRLVFRGGDMGLKKNIEYRRALEEKASRLGVAHAVEFQGFAANPRGALLGNFAALNLSRSESFSRTVLEACACGLPVIATKCGGPEEIVEDGRTGFLVPIDDPERCAQAMMALCRRPDLAYRMGRAGRARVMETFSLETFHKGLLNLLESQTTESGA